ncbi:MAG: glucose-1-phosphate adenylyltransferase subunit GlgD [Eubacterium sp.]
MKKAIGVILNVDGDNSDLNDLLQHRSISTLPFGGRYRMIDFTLSNMVNSGISHIGVVGSHKYSSLIDHLGTGKEWSLSRKTQDLSILSGSSHVRFGDMIKINMRDLYNNQAFLQHSNTDEDVVISASNLVTTFNFNSSYKIHKTNNSDVTLIFKKVQPRFTFEDNDVFIKFDKYKITDIQYKKDNTTDYCYADMLIIKKSVLLDLMELGDRTGQWDLMDMIKNNVDTLRIFGAPHTGYINRVNNLAKFFESNMDLLEFDIMKELFLGKNSIHTKIKDNHPTLYENDAIVRNSIVGSGCNIKGNITHSVVFRDSHIGKNSEINNSIIMQKCEIGDHVKLNYVIFDKDVKIRDNATLIGTLDNPIVLSKGMVV